MKSNPATEQAILTAAAQIFRREGLAGARMQGIADAAGINKALLHYYFDSKEMLYDAVRQAAVREVRTALHFLQDDARSSLPELLTKTVANLKKLADGDGDLFLFLCAELHRHPFEMPGGLDLSTSVLQHRLTEAAATGLMRPTSAHTLLTLVLALVVFPTFAHGLIAALTDGTQPPNTTVEAWTPEFIASLLLRFLQP